MALGEAARRVQHTAAFARLKELFDGLRRISG
jgi:hypothetical protein